MSSFIATNLNLVSKDVFLKIFNLDATDKQGTTTIIGHSGNSMSIVRHSNRSATYFNLLDFVLLLLFVSVVKKRITL